MFYLIEFHLIRPFHLASISSVLLDTFLNKFTLQVSIATLNTSNILFSDEINLISLGDLQWSMLPGSTCMQIYLTPSLIQIAKSKLVTGYTLSLNVQQTAFTINTSGDLTGLFPVSIYCMMLSVFDYLSFKYPSDPPVGTCPCPAQPTTLLPLDQWAACRKRCNFQGVFYACLQLSISI